MAKFNIVFAISSSLVVSIIAMNYNRVQQRPTRRNNLTTNSDTIYFRAAALREVLAEEEASPNKEKTSDNMQCLCSKLYDPVCSTSGKSFYNPCRLDCYARHHHKEITIKHQGNCIVY